MRQTISICVLWSVVLMVWLPYVHGGVNGTSDASLPPDPTVAKQLYETAEGKKPGSRGSRSGTWRDAATARRQEPPPKTVGFIKRNPGSPLSSPTDTLYLHGNEDYSHDPCWTPYGDHAMRGVGACFIYYYFDLQTKCVSDSSLEIGVEFASWSEEPSVLGPNLWAWDYTSEEWVQIAAGMGDQDDLVWMWYILPSPSDQWISDGGLVIICVESGPDDEVVVDDVGAACDPIYPDLTITSIWTEPSTFCQADSVELGFLVRNLGLCDVIDVFYCDLWLDLQWFGFVIVDSMPAGDSLTVVLHDIIWPDDTDSHTVYVMADTDDFVKESDEANNLSGVSLSAKPRPPAPSNVQATDGDHLDRVEISWDSASGATAYEIYRDETLLAADWPGTTYDDFGATPQEVHTYKVYACNECGCSPEYGSDTGHTGAVPVSIPLTSGWNWFSLNVVNHDMSLDSVLVSLGADAIYIKDQISFAEYIPEWGGWFGTLQNLTCECTYLIKMSQPGSLDYAGYQYDESTAMPLSSGWNWISYLPALSMPLDDALVSLDDHGTYIKNQTAFSEYVPEWGGWFGTLADMQPNDGFKIRMAVSDTLIYPVPPAPAESPVDRRGLARPGDADVLDWAVKPSDYEFSGSVTATVATGSGQTTVSSGDVLAAFVNGECRGLETAIETPGGDYVFCLMIHSNVLQGETLSFKYYDASKGMVQDMVQKVGFSADMMRGRATSPLRMEAPEAIPDHEGKAIPAQTALNRNQPDPFNTETTVSFSVSQAGHVVVEVFNTQGERVRVLVDGELAPGRHTVLWDHRNESGEAVSSGLYFCRMKTDAYTSIEKMTLLK